MGKKKGKKQEQPKEQGAAGGSGDAKPESTPPPQPQQQPQPQPQRQQQPQPQPQQQQQPQPQQQQPQKKKKQKQQEQQATVSAATSESVEVQPPQRQQKKKTQEEQQVPVGAATAVLPEPSQPQQQQKKKKQQKQEEQSSETSSREQTPAPQQHEQQPQKKKKGKQQAEKQAPTELAVGAEKPHEPPPATFSELAPPPGKKKQQQRKKEPTPPAEITEPAAPPAAKKQQPKKKEATPPVQMMETAPPPPGMRRPQPQATGFGRGQRQDVTQPERKPGTPTPGSSPAGPWGQRRDAPQGVGGPPPGLAAPRQVVQSPAAQPQPQPQQSRPPPGFAAPAQPRGPAKPAPGTLVPVSGGDAGVGSITKGLQTLRIPSRHHRDRCGTKGRHIVVETNHLALDLTKIKRNIVIHYDVTIDPDVPKRLLRHAMEAFRKRFYPNRNPAFDGKKNLYSSGELPFGGEVFGEVEVHDDESNRVRTFKITVKHVSRVDLHSLIKYMDTGTSLTPPQEAIQAIDIVLRNAPAFRFVQVGRSFFTPPTEQVVQLGDGLEMWYGFFQSAILGWKPFVNIDVAHKGFPSPRPVVEVICDLCRLRREDLSRELNIQQKEDFLTYIKGLKIDYMLPNVPASKRTYKVNNIGRSAKDQFFELDNGTKRSVEDYFRLDKRVPLYYPNLPCLNVGSPNRPKPIFVPAELCTVTRGQVINRKMNELQTSNMIKQAATNTDIRKRKILQALKAVGFNNDPCVQEFGLSVSDRFEKVDARILDPPQLEYNTQFNKRPVQPVRGVWRPTTFVSSTKLSNWIVLNLNPRYTKNDDLRRFGEDVQKMGKTLGMDIGPSFPPRDLPDMRRLEDFFREVKDKVQLVFVVVPDRGDYYAKVKQMAELHVGVLTQCIKARTMLRMNPATCSNILLKVNSKLNGINHTLAAISKPPCLKRPVMIVGADVTHPSPDQTDIPSVAAVCASHDPKAFKYNIELRLQLPRVEIIEDLAAIMKAQLMFFYKETTCKPERIIFFRDGVSEGQFAQVLNSEVTAIRQACASLSLEYKPKVTFLVVQKRHHTRFFPTRQEDAEGKNFNVPPGTVVDREITHPTEVDFYLVSHASIQGVSRPTKYRLLWNDDTEMSEDEIEAITYYLCHMFSRCTRSVSYPAPTYNAHLAAYRARVYLEGKKVKLTDLQSEQQRCRVLDDIKAGYPMFFV